MLERPSLQPPVIGVGIDTARYGHHVTFLREDRQPAVGAFGFAESREGYQRLEKTLRRLHRRQPEARFRVRIDAAGQYATNLECFLRQLKLPVSISVGEPARNKAYRQAHFPKRKADVTDSLAAARYAVVERPASTAAIGVEFYRLRELASLLESQVRRSTRLVNQLHNRLSRIFPELAVLAADLSAGWVLKMLAKYPTAEKIARAKLASLLAIAHLDESKAQAIQKAATSSVGALQGEVAEEIVRQLVSQLQQSLTAEKRLQKLLVEAYQALPGSNHRQLETIQGIGQATAAVLVAKMVSIDRFLSDRQLIGYFGVFPEENSSGVDKCGNPLPQGTMRISPKGNDLVRKYLWNAAMSAIRFNRAVRAVYARQRALGKRGDVALGHCMRKLLQQVFAVWKTGRPFDPNLYPHRKAQHQAEATQKAREEKKTAGRNQGKSPSRQAVTAASSRIPCRVPSQQPTVNPASQQKPTSSQKNGRVDFAFLRSQVTISRVLSHLGWLDRLRRRGSQARGPCPVHGSPGDRHRSFSVNFEKNVFQCFYPPCRVQGNVLDLWAAVQNLPLREAAFHLADTFRLQPAAATGNREEEPVS